MIELNKKKKKKTTWEMNHECNKWYDKKKRNKNKNKTEEKVN